MDIAMNADNLLGGCSFLPKIKAFADIFSEVKKNIEQKTVHEIITDIVSLSRYNEMLDAEYADEAQTRRENIEEFINSAYEFENSDSEVTLADFMQNIALLTDMDSSGQENGVSLMTVHAAKGLEFDTVFIAGVEEKIFPSRMSIDEDSVEEERRLCYVAITRAKRHLYILCAQRRSYFGDVSYNPVSRFIDEIDKGLLNDISVKRDTRDTTRSTQASAGFVPRKFFSGEVKLSEPKEIANTGRFSVGMTVSHKAFGQGKILSISGSGKQAVAVVDFDKAGTKKMFLAFAPLEVIC
jgi:DNA helicase-2/ATP-dependent DNA helicase PcrA